MAVTPYDSALRQLTADTFGLTFDERLAVLRAALVPTLEAAEKATAYCEGNQCSKCELWRLLEETWKR